MLGFFFKSGSVSNLVTRAVRVPCELYINLVREIKEKIDSKSSLSWKKC